MDNGCDILCPYSVGRSVALDCEMVGTGSEGSYSMLARACVVNHHGHVLYDSFVAPMDKITDYRTPISGVSPADLHGGIYRKLLVAYTMS